MLPSERQMLFKPMGSSLHDNNKIVQSYLTMYEVHVAGWAVVTPTAHQQRERQWKC